MNFHFPVHYAALVEAWEAEFRRLLAAWDSPTAHLTWFSMGQFQVSFSVSLQSGPKVPPP